MYFAYRNLLVAILTNSVGRFSKRHCVLMKFDSVTFSYGTEGAFADET